MKWKLLLLCGRQRHFLVTGLHRPSSGSRAGWDGIWVNAIRMDGLIHVSSRGARQISSACPTGISGVGHDQLPSALIISTGTPGDGSIPSMGGHFHGVMDTQPAHPARGPPGAVGDVTPFLLPLPPALPCPAVTGLRSLFDPPVCLPISSQFGEAKQEIWEEVGKDAEGDVPE